MHTGTARCAPTESKSRTGYLPIVLSGVSPFGVTGFEAGVRAIVGQQISVVAARTVLARVVAAHGDHGAFPEPERLVEAPACVRA